MLGFRLQLVSTFEERCALHFIAATLGLLAVFLYERVSSTFISRHGPTTLYVTRISNLLLT
jgi:hypothetical protein